MKLKDQKGQALVEMALLLPLLLLVVFGITEFGRALYIENTLVNAARDGARKASISPTSIPANDPAIKAYIKGILPDFAQTADITNTPASIAGFDTITVVINLPFQSTVPIIDQLKDITLKGQASMLYE